MSEIIGYNDKVILDQYGASVEAAASSRSSRPTGSAYVVTGYALVPHEVEIVVEADGPLQAMQKAKRMFDRGPNRKRFLVPNGYDEDAVFDFEPSHAAPPISQNAQGEAQPPAKKL